MRMDGSNRVLIDQNGWGVTIGSGTETKISGTLAWTRGNTVASGSSITLPVGNSAVITGTTNVDTIVATGTDGRHICVEFDNALTMKNATGNLFLGADFGPTNANSTLCLLSDGTKWRKTGGSIN
jgi:hypothetical protein